MGAYWGGMLVMVGLFMLGYDVKKAAETIAAAPKCEAKKETK